MKKFILINTLFCIMAAAYSQNTFQLPVITPPSEDDKAIRLSDLHISVFVVENIATTTMEMVFYNENNRIMEGEFNFPLANGVSVSRFALDINGELREGVVVEKEKATQAFEAITRRNVDPGLVEVTKGNNFKARVYPIPAKGYKKAVLAFEQELSGDDKDFIYQLPLSLGTELEKFSVRAEVVMNKPSIPKSKHPRINLEFTEARNSYIAEHSQENTILNSHITFSIPKPLELNKVLTYKGKVTSDNYFYINFDLKDERRSKPQPSQITLLWDESASAKNRDLEKDLSILSAYLGWMKEGKIEVKTFSNAIHEEKSFSFKEGKCPEIISFLKDRPLDGGTNISMLDFKSIQADEILLFTDGLSTFGKQNPYTFKASMMVINSSGTADHNLMEYFAGSSNGFYANASVLTTQEVVDQLTHEQKRFIRAEYNVENIKELYPTSGQAVTEGFSCAGIAEGAKNKVTLHFGYGNEITESHTIEVDNTDRIDNSMGERVWAQKKLKELLVRGTDAAVKAHGKKHSLVTPGTSLIVLDEVADYVRYEIIPPASLLSEYKRLKENQRKERESTREERIANICNQFESDYQWWENVGDFRNEKFEQKPKDNEKSDRAGNASPEVEEMLMMEVMAEERESSDVAYFMMETEAEMDEVVTTANGIAREKAELGFSAQFSAATMDIQQWDSDAAYMSDLKATDKEKLYLTYLNLKNDYEGNPSFYFDVATYMFQKKQMEAGLRVISNLAELELENAEIMRTMGRKLSEYKFYEEAIAAFEEVMKSRSFEPHSYLDLGLSYAGQGEYQKALENMYAIIEKSWDSDISSRFPGLEVIVLHEINNIIHQHKDKVDYAFIEECFIKNMPVDIRIVIDWDANDTDIDLWVTDPHGEKCSYSNKDTRIGGKISNDITRGYGPEEFRLKYAVDGDYTIEANFYGSGKQTGLSNVTVRAMVYTRFGSETEHGQVLTLQLEPNAEGSYTIGTIKFE